jgi:hypothetical protein
MNNIGIQTAKTEDPDEYIKMTQALIVNCFTTAEGKALLDNYLIPEFYDDPIITTEPAFTQRSLGRRDFVVEIMQVLRRHETGKSQYEH